MIEDTCVSLVSCIVPARNEAGHLEYVINRILDVPEVGQIIIVEGGSTDGTYEVAKAIGDEHQRITDVFKQNGSGKFNAVIEAAQRAKFDMVLIWDADGTVSMQDTRRIIRSAIEGGCAATGNRLIGNMEKKSMRFANKIGNWLFALLWSPILMRSPMDLLCGTKIFPRVVFDTLPLEIIRSDPFGDFALLANAKFLDIEIKSLKVDYFARSYGSTNIRRWSSGVQLLITTWKILNWLRKKNNV